MAGPGPVKRAVTMWLPPNTGCWLDRPSSPATRPVTLVSTGTVQLGREATGDVTPVVGGRDQDGVGRVAAFDERRQGGRHRNTWQGASEVAHVVDGGRPVLTQGGGQRGRLGSPGHSLDRGGHRPRLGQQLEGDRASGRSRPPRPAPILCRSPSQITFSCSRKATTRCAPSPSSTTISPEPRDSASDDVGDLLASCRPRRPATRRGRGRPP